MSESRKVYNMTTNHFADGFCKLYVFGDAKTDGLVNISGTDCTHPLVNGVNGELYGSHANASHDAVGAALEVFNDQHQNVVRDPKLDLRLHRVAPELGALMVTDGDLHRQIVVATLDGVTVPAHITQQA